MKKKTIIFAIFSAVIVAALATFFLLINKAPTPDEVFRNYVSRGLGLKTFAFEQTAEGTGSKLTATVVNDINNKKFAYVATSECSTTFDGKSIEVKATIQQDSKNMYIRLDEIDGTYANSEGIEFDLKRVYSKVKNKWYSLPEENKAVAALLDSGVAAYNSLLIAPMYDASVITDEIINAKVFSYKSVTQKDGIYSFQFVADRNAYANLLKTKFPNLSNADLVIESIFDDKPSIESTINVREDGTFIEEQLHTSNACPEVINTYIGEEPEGLAGEISSVSKNISFDDVVIDAVKNSKPIDKLVEDMNFQ